MKKKIIYGWMLLIFGMAVTSCSNLVESISPIKPVEESNTIYSETFASGLGNFTAKSVVGTENWIYNSNGYAIMTGYVGGVNKADETWLISPVIDLTNVTEAHFTFDHVARYFANAATDATIMISENYNNVDSLPTSATWTQLVIKPFVDPNAWPSPLPTSDQISLTSFAGKKIKIAFKYVSTTTKAGTWELKNFLVQRGEAVNLIGNSGKEAVPYTVSEAINNKGLSKYVKGYIVGYNWGGSSSANFFTADSCTQVANVLIADSVSDIYISKCLVVQLPLGIVRDSLNLKSGKARLFGKQVTVYGLLGSLASGLSQMSNTSYFILPNGSTGGIKPIEPILSETFAKTLGDFTTQNVLGAQVWGVSFSAATMTGYVSPTNNANEDWLISPVVDLTTITAAKLSFDHVIRYCTNPVTDGTIWVSENYVDGLPSTATWTQLPTSTFKDPGSWTFSTIGPISLASYSGKKIRFAFKYLSTTTKAGTWEIKNVLVLK
ncbi:MAG: choice-of-anchor J domain-containing protein [Paludibacter sp.]|nr:choice-of-anchor J domain-containing protein [Paludibacter sp.]